MGRKTGLAKVKTLGSSQALGKTFRGAWTAPVRRRHVKTVGRWSTEDAESYELRERPRGAAGALTNEKKMVVTVRQDCWATSL